MGVTLLPISGLLTCLRPLFLPSGCWMRRFCWPGSLCTLATLPSTNSVSVSGDRAVRKIVLWWVLAQVTYTKQSLQRYHYLWRKVGKEPQRQEFSKVWEEGQGLCSPQLPKLRFCFQSRCHSSHSAKTVARSHPWFGNHQKVWDVIFQSQFFSPGGGKNVVTNTHKQLYHMDGNTFFEDFNLNESKMDEYQTHQTQNPFGWRGTFSTCLQPEVSVTTKWIVTGADECFVLFLNGLRFKRLAK